MFVDPGRAFTGLGELRVERLQEAQAVPCIRISRRALQHHRPHRGEHDRRTRRLHRTRIHHRFPDRVELPRVRRDLAGQHPIDDFEVFLQPRHPLPRRPVGDSHHLAGGVDGETDPEPELDASARDVVETQRLSRERRRVAKRDLGYAGAKSQGGGGLGDGAERSPQVEPGIGRIRPVDEVVRESAEVEPQRLDAPESIEHRFPRHVGDDEHFEPEGAGHHRVSSGPALLAFALPRPPRPSGPRPGGT